MLYSAKPWVLFVGGGILSVGATLWSLVEGFWTGWRGSFCFLGAIFAIGGGAIIQMRQNYRSRSKWRRESPR